METQTQSEFAEFPKIARLSRRCIITEKIDGTNGQICITDDGGFRVGSRTRWITPEQDNYGFARWAYANKDELMRLGPGRHFGEWWGGGIQRGYGLQKDDKRWWLFNVQRWCLHNMEPKQIPVADPTIVKFQERLPTCCGLVPVLYDGLFRTEAALDAIAMLTNLGSVAVPGYLKPEGIVVYHVAGNVAFKKTIEKDEEPKSKR